MNRLVIDAKTTFQMLESLDELYALLNNNYHLFIKFFYSAENSQQRFQNICHLNNAQLKKTEIDTLYDSARYNMADCLVKIKYIETIVSTYDPNELEKLSDETRICVSMLVAKMLDLTSIVYRITQESGSLLSYIAAFKEKNDCSITEKMP
ncbi:hypothetical protein NPIL_323991 [Nephila pilipes]|uniref:Uncharacterized protein n=1 Tax=Nephila pilipes TaxID=299642 RepID=A0A8X6PQ63_NEPPI|nr:hypothetical protein NPIL_323991 [Nephila pilipes]